MEETNQDPALERIKTKMAAMPPPPSRMAPPPPRTPQLHLKMSRPKQASPGMEGKTDPQVEEGRAEDPKMVTTLLQDSQGRLQGGTETAPLKEEAAVAARTTMESKLKAAEPAEGEGGSSTVVVGVSEAPTLPVQDPAGEGEAEWEGEVEETTGHRSLGATLRSPKGREPEADTVRITGPSITPPGPGTAVKLAAKAPSTKRSRRGGGREALRRAARVEEVILQTKKKTRRPTPRMAQRTPTPPPRGTCPPLHPEAHRPASSPPEGFRQGEVVAGEAEEEMSTEGVATLEDQLGVTGSYPTPAHTTPPPSPRLQAADSKVHLTPLAPETRGEEGTQERRKIRELMEIKLKTRGPTPLSRLCPLQYPLLCPPQRTESSFPNKLPPTQLRTLEDRTLSLSLQTEASHLVDLNGHPGVAVTGVHSTSRTNRPASAG